jgi:hypothetical protein
MLTDEDFKPVLDSDGNITGTINAGKYVTRRNTPSMDFDHALYRSHRSNQAFSRPQPFRNADTSIKRQNDN